MTRQIDYLLSAGLSKKLDPQPMQCYLYAMLAMEQWVLRLGTGAGLVYVEGFMTFNGHMIYHGWLEWTDPEAADAPTIIIDPSIGLMRGVPTVDMYHTGAQYTYADMRRAFNGQPMALPLVWGICPNGDKMPYNRKKLKMRCGKAGLEHPDYKRAFEAAQVAAFGKVREGFILEES